MISVSVSAAIIAVTEAIKRTVPSVNGIVTIIVAGVLGILAGLAKIDGLDWLSGLVTGLTAVGVIKTASVIAGK